MGPLGVHRLNGGFQLKPPDARNLNTKSRGRKFPFRFLNQ